MLSMMTPPLPPTALADDALKLAATILAIAADPSGTQARLTELTTATQGLRDAIAQNEAAAAKASEVEAAQAAVAARERDVATREAALTASQTALAVASAAVADRDQAVKDREAASDKREAEIAAKQTALEQRIAGYRQALG